MGADSWNLLRGQGRIRIRRQLWYTGPTRRTDIAAALQLSLPAVTTAVNGMIEAGLARETSKTDAVTHLGRRAALVDIAEDARCFIGVEMRRDSRSACLTDYRGHVLLSLREEGALPDYRQNCAAVCRLIRALLAQAPVAPEKLRGMGVAVPGVVDEHGVLASHRMYGWYDCHIAEDIAAGTGWQLPITVGNDACVRAFGARMQRRKEMDGIHTFAYLLIARGISCPYLPCEAAGVGQPLGIGELGYMVLRADDAIAHGQIAGNVSDLCGERAIMDRCHEAMRAGQVPQLLALCGGDVRPTIPQIMAAAQAGEQAVRDILADAVRYLAVALANVCNFVQPGLIFIDSRLFEAEQNRRLLTEEVARYLVSIHKGLPAFEFIVPEGDYGAHCAAFSAIRADLDTADES